MHYKSYYYNGKIKTVQMGWMEERSNLCRILMESRVERQPARRRRKRWNED
jgi:hypothetical protein